MVHMNRCPHMEMRSMLGEFPFAGWWAYIELMLICRWIATFILNAWFIVNAIDHARWYLSFDYSSRLAEFRGGRWPDARSCWGDALTPSCWDPVGLLFTLSSMGNGFHWGCVCYSAKSYTHTVIQEPLTAACDDG